MDPAIDHVVEHSQHDSGASDYTEKDSITKQEIETTEVSVEDGKTDEYEEQKVLSVTEPFPVDPDAPVEEQQFTVRAVLTGCCLGGLIAASNMYLGLKTG